MSTGPGYLPEVLIGVGGARVYGSSIVYVDGGQGMSSVTIDPGLAREAVINPLIAGGAKTFLFTEGTYSFSAQPFAGLTPAQLSGVKLIGLGDDRTVFTAAYSKAVGLADDPTNALLPFFGSSAAPVVSTTVAAAIPAMYGSPTFTVTSAAGIVAGMYLQIQAHNAPTNPTDMLDMSDGASIILTELVEVLSVAGAVVTLKAPLKQWHTPGAAVVSVTPVVNVLVRGIYLDCTGGSIACGVSASLAETVLVQNCSVRGFSRAGVSLQLGTREVKIEKLRSHGECNSIVLGDSAMVVEVSEVATDEKGARFHANGIARWCIQLFQRCVDWKVEQCLLQHACGGICHWGGMHIQWGPDLKIRDMDPSRIRTTNTAYGALGVIGAGVDSGAGPLGIESFAYGVEYLGVEVHDCQNGDDNTFGWFMHDTRGLQVRQCGIWNHGPVWGTVVNGITYKPQGFRLNDCQGTIDIGVWGCTFGFYVTGTPDVDVKLKMAGAAGNGSGTVPIWIDAGGFTGLRFTSIIVDNYSSATFGFGASFIATPDYTLRCDYLKQDGSEWTDLSVYGTVPAVVIGGVYQIDATSPVGTKRLIASTGPTTRNAVAAVPAGAGSYTMGTSLPASLATANVTGAGNAGDFVEANAANQGVPNAAAAAGTRLGRLLETKAAALGLVRLGTAN